MPNNHDPFINPNRSLAHASAHDYDVVRNKNTFVDRYDLDGLDAATRNELMLIDSLNDQGVTSPQELSG